ncbi:hypothetical protein OSB04_024454 [Centaurea solstitialis]|uniref:Uncharacterized protein n=1 Tax=Centaurea solstitialis TaxID=347529 RepID=A0AA38W0N2_9ASTR|nr:hypothetical protein OSB04_024454 [Centaurea solstitialis]
MTTVEIFEGKKDPVVNTHRIIETEDAFHTGWHDGIRGQVVVSQFREPTEGLRESIVRDAYRENVIEIGGIRFDIDLIPISMRKTVRVETELALLVRSSK